MRVPLVGDFLTTDSSCELELAQIDVMSTKSTSKVARNCPKACESAISRDGREA